MPDQVKLWIDGGAVEVPAGTTIAAAIIISGKSAFRRSVSGEPRGPLCAMGICFECRVTVDGAPHSRSCQIPCTDGMKVTTG